jgi:hypothetical protein
MTGCERALETFLPMPTTTSGDLGGPDRRHPYGRCKAMIMKGDDGLLFIHSFAHGRTLYRLRYDYRHAVAAIEYVRSMDDVCPIEAISEFEADEQDMFVRALAVKLDLKQPVVKKRFAEERDRRSRQQRLSIDARRASDRVTLPAPPPHGALSAHVVRLDAILAEGSGPLPPIHNVGGRLVEVRTMAPEGLHNIAVGGDVDVQPTIRTLSPTGIQMLIEKYVNHETEKSYQATLLLPFIDALDGIAGSRIPAIRAINTAPIVRLDGTVIAGDGLDRHAGLCHVIEPLLRQCVPQQRPTNDDGRGPVFARRVARRRCHGLHGEADDRFAAPDLDRTRAARGASSLLYSCGPVQGGKDDGGPDVFDCHLRDCSVWCKLVR